ncbi:MAG: tetratricopeptide repeat protein, partial [Bacteroidota bacterium]
LGVVSSTKGNTLEALRWFRKSVEVNPGYAQGYFNLAALYAKMGNSEASVEALKKAAHLGHSVARESLRREGISW